MAAVTHALRLSAGGAEEVESRCALRSALCPLLACSGSASRASYRLQMLARRQWIFPDAAATGALLALVVFVAPETSGSRFSGPAAY